MYIYDDKLFGSRSLLTKQSITSWPAQRHSHYPDRVVSGFLGRVGVNSGYGWAYEGLGQLIAEELSEKLKFLSLLPTSR